MTSKAYDKIADGAAEIGDMLDSIRLERGDAAQRMADEFAGLHMPEDIRSRAKAWGMEIWATVLWNNAFQAGYRAALRSLAAEKEEKNG